MTQDNEASAARAVIEEYVAAYNDGNIARLRVFFLDQATMSGHMIGEYISGLPEPFFQAVKKPGL